MKRIDVRQLLCAFALMTCAAATPHAAETELAEAYCSKQALTPTGGESTDGRRYAPDRNVDIIHLTLDVTPDFEQRTISGTTTIRFAPIGMALSELRLDAVDLEVTGIESSEDLLDTEVTANEIILTFASPLPAGREATVTIEHSAEPTEGLYFRTPALGYPEGNEHMFTQGEPFSARHWFPSYDAPNEKFTSQITCRVPEAMVVFSNGRKIAEETDPDTGLKAVTWLQDKPHPNYLIALCAGFFVSIEDDYNGLPLSFTTPPAHAEWAKNSYRGTADMMAFFEDEIGVPYPWDQYAQVVVDDFVAGGMENTSLTILTTRTLFPDSIGNVRNSESLVAHELAHQWFGDLVTCKDWSHLWLNESFATYYDWLYHDHAHGADSRRYVMLGRRDSILADESDPLPIVWREYDNANERFGYRVYTKGGWVLHMLRTQLGEELFRESIQTYLERNAYGNVVTEDLNSVVEEISGRSFDRFFDQWIYHGKHPKLDVRYEWLAAEKLAKITVHQTQETGDDVMLFDFPATVRFFGADSSIDRTLAIREAEADFFIPLDFKPEIVRFDPDLNLLADISFDIPKAMLHAQLENERDAIGRVLACRVLEDQRDAKSVAKLKRALNEDSFYGVRLAASRALRKIGSDKAFEALLESMNQEDARVRRSVAGAVGGFFEPRAREALVNALTGSGAEAAAEEDSAGSAEGNPAVAASMIGGLGKYPSDSDLQELLGGYLRSDSFRQMLAVAAIGAIRSLDDPAMIDALSAVLRERESEFTTRGFASGLDALAWIARNEDDKDGVRSLIEDYVNDPNTGRQRAALRALGTLRDPKAISVVKTFADRSPSDPAQRTAKASLKKLRDAKSVPVEISDLRGEVTELESQLGDLTERFDELEGKLDSRASGAEGRKKRWFFGLF